MSRPMIMKDEPYEVDRVTGNYLPRSQMDKSPFSRTPDGLGPSDRGRETGNTGYYHERGKDLDLPDRNGDDK